MASGERPYKCNMCSKDFTDPGAWRRHLQTHSGEKKFQCEYCGKYLSRRDKVTRHQKICKKRPEYLDTEGKIAISIKTQHCGFLVIIPSLIADSLEGFEGTWKMWNICMFVARSVGLLVILNYLDWYLAFND